MITIFGYDMTISPLELLDRSTVSDLTEVLSRVLKR